MSAFFAIIHIYLLLASMFKAFLATLALPKTGKTYKFQTTNLPIYTVMIPLYKEAHMISKIISAMSALIYPREKLQVLLVLEADDVQTVAAAQAANKPSWLKVVVVPDSKPKTKPKACNYALRFAKGEFLTIYDAEDIPDPDQLIKAVSMFRQLPANYACLQASLTYYNKKENWLTRMFYLEYTFWFNLMVQGMGRHLLPIPLGGTSNHFKTEVLRKLGGWNSVAVTEDAEIGLRIAAEGYEVGHLPSYTHEEAVNSMWPWIKQRTRWIKGYLQTFESYGLKSFGVYNTKGIKGLLIVFLFVFGTPIFSLLTAPLLVIFLSWLLFDPQWVHGLFEHAWEWELSWICLGVGNLGLVFFHGLATWRKGERLLALWAIFLPFYWILHSIAAWRALSEYLRRDWSWAKTEHGKSKVKFKTWSSK